MKKKTPQFNWEPFLVLPGSYFLQMWMQMWCELDVKLFLHQRFRKSRAQFLWICDAVNIHFPFAFAGSMKQARLFCHVHKELCSGVERLEKYNQVWSTWNRTCPTSDIVIAPSLNMINWMSCSNKTHNSCLFGKKPDYIKPLPGDDAIPNALHNERLL